MTQGSFGHPFNVARETLEETFRVWKFLATKVQAARFHCV